MVDNPLPVDVEGDRMPVLRPMIRRLGRFLAVLWDQVTGDKVIIRGSGLAYVSLLATVPLVAVLFSVFTAFAAFEDLRGRVEQFIFSQVLPTHQDEIIRYINQFTENTSKLGVAGVLFLFGAAILLLDNVESNFNDIWSVRQRRSLISKLTAYTSVLVFGTLLIGASLSLSAQLKAMLMPSAALDIGVLTWLGSRLFTLLLSLGAFLVMYLVIPNTRVKLVSAAVGAGVAGVLWELAKSLFAFSVERAVQYSTLYGSLATVPIFLVWLYITWIIILLGLEIAYSHQSFHALDRQRRAPRMGGAERLTLALKIAALVADAFHRRSEPPTAVQLAERLDVPITRVNAEVERLLERELIRRAAAGDEEGLIPATSLERISVSDVIRSEMVDAGHGEGSERAPEDLAEELLARFQEAGHRAVDGVTLADLVSGVPES